MRDDVFLPVLCLADEELDFDGLLLPVEFFLVWLCPPAPDLAGARTAAWRCWFVRAAGCEALLAGRPAPLAGTALTLIPPDDADGPAGVVRERDCLASAR